MSRSSSKSADLAAGGRQLLGASGRMCPPGTCQGVPRADVAEGSRGLNLPWDVVKRDYPAIPKNQEPSHWPSPTRPVIFWKQWNHRRQMPLH
jgi:hypothetical protein